MNQIRLCGEKFNDGSLTPNFSINAPVRDYLNGKIVVSSGLGNNNNPSFFVLFSLVD